MSAPRSTQNAGAERSVTLRLEHFAWEAIDGEASSEGSTIEELIAFSVLYYLADVDSGRISRRISRSPYQTLPDDRQSGGTDRRPLQNRSPIRAEGPHRAQ
jgi:hypothetical protein